MTDAEKKVDDATKIIARVGKQLGGYKTCPSKDNLTRLLKQAVNALSNLKQSQSLKLAVKPLHDSLNEHGLLVHKDKDVKLLVGNCVCEIIRILAPDPDFSDKTFKDVFRLLFDIFGDLGDIASPYFSNRAKLLEKVAKLQFCVLMLDTGCDDLALKMFKRFFNVVREDHPQYVINSMSLLMTSILEEKLKEPDSNYFGYESNACQSLLDVVLHNIIKDRKGVSPASLWLASSVIQDRGQNLERCICLFLNTCISNRDASASPIKEFYHNIILEVFQLAPQMLLSVMPNLTHELMTDQVDVRIKAVNLIRKLLLLPGPNVAREYDHIFFEMLNRFSDKSAEVRRSALSCAKALYSVSPENVLDAIRGRLLDHDEKVRSEAVNVVCELAKANLDFELSDSVSQASERLRDKKVSVRSKALKKLLELYQVYCTRCEMETGLLNKDIEEIPCKVLMLCYEKGCQEYRPQSMERLLADLFPPSLSIKQQIRHWMYLFSVFQPAHLKALKIILCQKRRLQDGLTEYVDLCNRPEGNDDGESERKMEALVMKMSACFPEPGKAKDCFQKLKELDSPAFSVLHKLLKEETTIDFRTTKEVYLRELGGGNELSDFFCTLYTKCSYNIFNTKHVSCIMDFLADMEAKLQPSKNHLLQLLLTIVGAFPSLLGGSKEQFQLLLSQKKIPFNEQLMEMLVAEGCRVPIKLRDVYSSLQNLCLEGSRKKAKLAVSVIAALAESSDHLILTELHKVLLHSLSKRENVPTVLQSLGCLAQHFVSAFETHEKVITQFIVEQIFQGRDDVLASKDVDFGNVPSQWCRSCKLKVFGLKAIVRSFLPHKDTHINRSISFLLDIILQMLLNSEFSASNKDCEQDQKCIPSAAAKSVLHLSRKWDLYMSPQIYRLTILTVKDQSSEVRRLFVRKIQKLLINRSLPCRYACAFSFAAVDSIEYLHSDALKYLEEFIHMYGKVTHLQGASNNPVYLVVFLIHVLAHDSDFPPPDCQHEKVYAQFLSPLFVTVQALVKESSTRGDMDHASNIFSTLRNIFNAIKRAEDAIDDEMTPKLHFLAEIGISILSSLVNNRVHSSRSPGLILLPSSLYKSGASQTRQATVYPMMGCKDYASFANKLVFCLKNEVPRIRSTGDDYFLHLRDNSPLLNCGKHSASEKSGAVELFKKSKEQIDEMHTESSHQADRRVCLNDKMSSHILKVKSGYQKKADIAHRTSNAKAALTGELVMARPSLSRNKIIISCSGEDTSKSSNANDAAEPTKKPSISGKVSDCSSKIAKRNGEALVGRHIRVWSPLGKSSNSGVVDNFDYTMSMHQITYDSGEIEVLSLDSQKWEIDQDDAQVQHCDHAGDSSSTKENMPKNRDLCAKEVSRAAKRTKRSKDDSKSEITEINRARRQS